MARARNKTDITAANASDEAAELDAIEAALNGDGDDLEINDSRFSEEPEADASGLTEQDLAELDAMTTEVATMSAETDPEVDEAALASALEVDEAMSAAYEEQTSEIDLANDDEVAAAAAASAKAGKTKTGTGKARSTGSKVVVTEDPELFAAAALAAFKGEEITLDSEEGALDSETFVARMKAMVTQKKAREKVLNLIEAVVAGKSPSIYTKLTAGLMLEASVKGETVSMAQIKALFESKGYKAGTVNAQAGQMMSIFPALGMAKSSTIKGVLEPAPSSVLLDFMAEA